MGKDLTFDELSHLVGATVVSCDFDGPIEEMTDVGYISHFATCPFADRHRKKRKP